MSHCRRKTGLDCNRTLWKTRMPASEKSTDVGSSSVDKNTSDSERGSCCSHKGCDTPVEIVERSENSGDGERCLKIPESILSKDKENGSHGPHHGHVHETKDSKVQTVDLEKGSRVLEHVTLAVQGMTCTGCERKLFRALSLIPSISNIKTSLVISQARFNIHGTDSVDDIIRQLERTTGFRFEELAIKGQQLEVLRTRHMDAIFGQTLPPGVTDVKKVDERIVRIEYDGSIIGARELHDGYLGIPLQLAPIHPNSSVAEGYQHLRKVGLRTVISIALTIPVLVLAWAPLPENKIVYGSISLALATVVQVLVAGPFYKSAAKSLIFAGTIDMDLLIVLSASSAYIFSLVWFGSFVRGNSFAAGDCFATSTLLITLIMVGGYASALARQKAVESVSIRSLQETTALLVNDNGKSQRRIDSRLLQHGDIFCVPPDSRIATDGTVVSGRSEVDESMVTGESKLIDKSIGSAVVAGSTNGCGLLNVRVTRLPGDNTISTIASMVDEAKLSKPKVQEIADRVAKAFIPIIVVLAIITFVVWMIVGVVIRHQASSGAAVEAITYAIAVLIVSCPCAIGLATPIVLVIAGGVAADHGVVFKTAETLENARKTSNVVFDKTGTLTNGKLVVSAVYYCEDTPTDTVSILLGLISKIKHPVAAAVASYLEMQDIKPSQVHGIRTVTGRGVEGIMNNITIRAGNPFWLGVEDHFSVQPILAQGLTVFCLLIDAKIHAVFGLEDSLRPDAISVVSTLFHRGITVSIVSGDNEGAVHKIATQLGIPLANTRFRCSPVDKQKYVQEIIQNSCGAVLFCGDGTNDAIALAQATIGVHISEGTDLAQSAADVVLVHPKLSGILVLIDLSRAAFRRIVFNFCWAFVYNLVAILLAAGAFVHVRILPQYAGLSEVVSVLPVIAAAVHLRYVRFN